MDILDNHISIAAENDVNQICAPFFAASNIHYFHYAILHKTSYCYGLVSNAKWHKYFFKENLFLNTNLLPSNGGCLISSFNSKTAVVASKLFNINYLFEIIQEHENYYSLLGFATNHTNAKIIDFFYSNQDLLRNFGMYFRDKASQLLKVASLKRNRIYMPSYKETGLILKNEPYSQQRAIPDKIKPNRYFLDCYGYEVYLTRREIECLSYLLKFRTTKEIAKILSISEKTAEFYIASARDKLNCNSRSELFDKLHSSKFTSLVDVY